MANSLKFEKQVQVAALLCEGNSIRGIERITGIHRDTIMRLGVRIGEGCRGLQDDLFRRLGCQLFQLDEMWGFIGAKQKVAKAKGKEGCGDIWLWVAIDAATKLVPSFMTGKRDQQHCTAFVGDLASRLNSRPQISADGLSSYNEAIEAAFGREVDFGSVIKTFADKDFEQERRYSPPKVASVKKVVKQGNPDEDLISTSYVEKQNHTVRMHLRRLSRLTNAFSKKRENFDAAVALHYAYYNLCKNHLTIKCTPAMEAGVTTTQWSVADLLERIQK